MIFDLEQQLLQCWSVTEDLKLVEQLLENSTLSPQEFDSVLNLVQGIRSVYDARFENTWKTFERVCSEYHKLKRPL